MFPRIKELQKIQNLEKTRRRLFKETQNLPVISSIDCKQAIPITKGVYCGVWKEKAKEARCQHCPYFDLEPSEYRLFKRT